MKALITLYAKIIDKITEWVGAMAGILVLLTAVAIFIEVVMRGIFNSPTEWAVEMAVYFVLIAGFLGMPIAYSAGKHINVDIFISHLNPRTKCVLEIFNCIIAVIFCAIFFNEALGMSLLSLDMNQLSPSTLRVPLWIPQMALPIGMGLLVLQFLKTILQDILKVKEGAFAAGEVDK